MHLFLPFSPSLFLCLIALRRRALHRPRLLRLRLPVPPPHGASPRSPRPEGASPGACPLVATGVLCAVTQL